MTIDGRQSVIELAFGGRLALMDTLLWKMTFNGRQPLIGDNLRWKMSFDGRRPLMEDNLRCKTTFDGRQQVIINFLGRVRHGKRSNLSADAFCQQSKFPQKYISKS